MNSSHVSTDDRILVLVPTRGDALLCESLLSEASFQYEIFPNVGSLAHAIEAGGAALLMTDSSIRDADLRGLTRALQRQPAWSDLPIVLLCENGADSPIAAWALDTLGNVTIFDRPVRKTTLVSALRAACRARRRQYELREADRRKDEFLATLSHELRNPLAPLRNALQLLKWRAAKRGAADPVYDLMERQVQHLVRLVDDLLDLSRVTRGTLTLRPERVTLTSLVDAAIETSEPLITSAEHKLEVSLPSEPIILRGDPVRLAQVISNLLNNAAKYTNPAGSIQLRAVRENKDLVISVRDNGSGISPAALRGLFQMFSRGDRAVRNGDSGLGIGLAIARRLVEMHGGTIQARSQGAGLGSEFIIRLPVITDASPDPRTSMPLASIDAPGRILIVDDNRDAAETLGMVLQSMGAEVRVAQDGAEALQLFREQDPAVVLMDIGMPGMDGYEVARVMRSEFPERRTTLVALTGWGQEEDLRRAHDAGFDHHLVKPAPIASIQTLLESVGRAARQAV